MTGKSYIIRIYRIDADNPESVVGTIEDVERAEKKEFKGMYELWKRIRKTEFKKEKKQPK